MLSLACKIPRKIAIAVSGGPDSMSLLNFAQRGRKDIDVIHINHGTPQADKAQNLVNYYCLDNKIRCTTHYVPSYIKPTEDGWRQFRLGIYKRYTDKGIFVATGHQLDDMIEWLLLTFIHGRPKCMVAVDEKYKLMKPFLLTEKNKLINWCHKFDVPYITDTTNIGEGNSRAILRQHVIPTLLKIHPGMKTSMKNKLINKLL